MKTCDNISGFEDVASGSAAIVTDEIQDIIILLHIEG